MAQNDPRPPFIWFALLMLLLAANAQADEPFGPNDFDVVYSDATSVRYEVDRTCLADLPTCLGAGAPPSPCGALTPLTSLGCNVGIHRFCTAQGHRSGWGMANPGNASLVDITCTTKRASATFSPTHNDLKMKHGGCTSALPSLLCNVAIDRFCRDQPGYQMGFGPVERNSSIAVVTCIEADAGQSFAPAKTAVESLVAGCTLATATVSTACRQAMDVYCQSQDPDLRGGFGPRELSTNVNLGCANRTSPWVANTTLPESPGEPVDVLDRRIDLTSGQNGNPLAYEPDFVHAALGSNRSLSFDGRLTAGLKIVNDPVLGEQRFMQFSVQTPEIFEEPLTQQQPAGKRRSFEFGFFNDFFAEKRIETEFHRNTTGGVFEANSTAICDPHQGAGALAQANRQQSVPDRVSNPLACNVHGKTDADPGPNNKGPYDHDCYDVTVVTVFDTGTQDELWGTPVRVVVAHPKVAGMNGTYQTRARVIDVQVQGTPQQAPFPAGQPRHILEPNITGDGRLIIIQGDGMIRYAVMDETDDPCDVTQWTSFKHLYEMHTDPLMADYGIAKFPLRDFENNVISPTSPGPRVVRAAYPWIDRDGDNMMFMLGASTLFYVDGQGQAQEKYEVVGHPFHGTQPTIPCPTCPSGTQPLHPTTAQDVALLTDPLPRAGLTIVGLWTQGKMFAPDSRNNGVDYVIPGSPPFHRLLRLYSDVPTGTEVGGSQRTSINAIENQLFFRPNLRPDTPREVVWQLSTQGQTDEVAFDDVTDPDALIISTMGTAINATNPDRGRFQDGFVHTGLRDGEGFQHPARIANAAAATQWVLPSHGSLLGGARAEPIAAGGFRGRGLWLDGTDDRLDYIVPEQTTGMANRSWFYNVSIDPRDLSTPRRLLTLPDGTWLDVVHAQLLRFGRTASVDITIPAALALAPRAWSTIGIVSAPRIIGGFEIRVYLDGYRLATVTPPQDYFRMAPGLVSVGAETDGFAGWVDDVKVIGRAPGAEVICNHARGTLVGVEMGDTLEGRANAYPAASHAALTSLLPVSNQFDTYACERPIANPTDVYDADDHDHYGCLGQTRRLDGHPQADKCLREPLLFPEGPLAFDQPRPSSLSNSFCLSCHVDSNPSVTMQATDALGPDLIVMHQDLRRQPMQNSPKFFGNVPAFLFGTQPTTPFLTPPGGVFLDFYTIP